MGWIMVSSMRSLRDLRTQTSTVWPSFMTSSTLLTGSFCNWEICNMPGRGCPTSTKAPASVVLRILPVNLVFGSSALTNVVSVVTIAVLLKSLGITVNDYNGPKGMRQCEISCNYV